MTKHKIQNKHKAQISNIKTKVLVFVILTLNLFCILNFDIYHLRFSIRNSSFAQDNDLELTLDLNSNTVALPKIFKPSIDLSGRGFHREISWPQILAAPEVLDIWQKDIGFGSAYRLQYNLWEIAQLAKDKVAQDKLLSNYENIIKKITDEGGIVILDIFSTPAGLGKVLDKKSPPLNLKAFKELVKDNIRNLSCEKRYNIWYEVWSAPDIDDFFLGRRQEYLNLYRAVGEAINELETEAKVHIPLGGPSISWWFQDIDSNTIITPEKSLIYELIKFCAHNRMPLDFITWHGYSTDPNAEKEITLYRKSSIALIRDWLSYFNFDKNTPLAVDEWNYDSGANVLPERSERSNICSSYVLSRIKNMYDAGIDYQFYFCLEDFENNKEGVVRNVGIFWFRPEASDYKGGPKSIYNAFRMLSNLGRDMFVMPKFNDEFVGTIATKAQDRIVILIYNYIDPEIARNYISRNISSLNSSERKILLNLIKSDKLDKITHREIDVSSLRASNKVKALLKKAQELNAQADKFKSAARNIKMSIKNIKGSYLYQKYTIDLSCNPYCEFVPSEQKEIDIGDIYQETLALNPYSVHMIILNKKTQETEGANVITSQQPSSNTAIAIATAIREATTLSTDTNASNNTDKKE